MLNVPTGTQMGSRNKDGTEEESLPANRDKYQRLMRKLIYLTHIRLGIGYAVNMTSHYMTNPTKHHMKAVNHILQHLKKTPRRGLHFKKNLNRGIEIFTDADWAGPQGL